MTSRLYIWHYVDNMSMMIIRMTMPTIVTTKITTPTMRLEMMMMMMMMMTTMILIQTLSIDAAQDVFRYTCPITHQGSEPPLAVVWASCDAETIDAMPWRIFDAMHVVMDADWTGDSRSFNSSQMFRKEIDRFIWIQHIPSFKLLIFHIVNLWATRWILATLRHGP